MQRVTLFIAFLILPVVASAQKYEVVDGKMLGILPVNDIGRPSYQLVKTVAGVSKDELFKRARRWFVKTYNSAQAVLQTNDSQTGELVGKGIFNVPTAMLGINHIYPISHTISVEVKDEKYRVILTDLVVKDIKLTAPVDDVPMAGKKFHTKFFESIDTKANLMLDDLDRAMRTSDDF